MPDKIEKGDLFELGAGKEAVTLEYTGDRGKDHLVLKNLSWPGRGAAEFYCFTEWDLTNGITCKRISKTSKINPLIVDVFELLRKSEHARKQFVDCLSAAYGTGADGVQYEILEAARRLPEDLKLKLVEK